MLWHLRTYHRTLEARSQLLSACCGRVCVVCGCIRHVGVAVYVEILLIHLSFARAAKQTIIVAIVVTFHSRCLVGDSFSFILFGSRFPA